MDRKLYDLMDWAEVESIVYGECDHPHQLLGARVTKEGVLYTYYNPEASDVQLKLMDKDKTYAMELIDEMGYYAYLLPGKRISQYQYIVCYSKIVEHQIVVEKEVINDPYSFTQQIHSRDMKLFETGKHDRIYDRLGAHMKTIGGVQGTHFVVWAPNAVAVSLVCDSNGWDHRRNLMERVGSSGIFELFLPGLGQGEVYKYAIKHAGGRVTFKADPYGFVSELRPNNANVVWDMDQYFWQDGGWSEENKACIRKQMPMVIYEMQMGSFIQEDTIFPNYREVADDLVVYLRDMKYTHVQLMPITEYPLDESLGYQTTGYYSVTSRYGKPDDFKYFIDTMHLNGIGVILEWVPTHFPRDSWSLAQYDGTSLYEHCDDRRGITSDGNNLIFQYNRPMVRNFLIGSALFWLEHYHLDGLKINGLDSMLYLDFDRCQGEWVPNIYGGNENIEAMAFLSELTSIIHTKHPEKLIIAESTSCFPNMEELGIDLGLDFICNTGWKQDFCDYIQRCDESRTQNHSMLTRSAVYNYTDDFILALDYRDFTFGKKTFINKVPGRYEDKFANMRVAYGYMMTFPGKKLLFMGQDIGQFDEWNGKDAVQFSLTHEYESHAMYHDYVRDLHALYHSHPALWEWDYNPDGFQWLSTLDAEHCVFTFVRRSEKETLLILLNFSKSNYEQYRTGVLEKGKYKEIFNSDRVCYGGGGRVNSRLKTAKLEAWDGLEYSIRMNLAPYTISVIRYQNENK